jgi:adenylate cyclase
LKQHLVRILIGLAITLLFIGHAARRVPQVEFINRIDHLVYDARLKMSMPHGVDPRVVILDIDEKSLGEVGRWPWSRNVMAQLVTKLFDQYGVKVLGFDVVWAERDTSSGMTTLDQLAQGELKDTAAFQAAYERLRPRLDYDGQFAAAIKGRAVVLGYYFATENNAARVNMIPQPVLPKGAFAGRDVQFSPPYKGYTGNLPALQNNAMNAGHFNPYPDDDGVQRRVPVVIEYEGAYYEAMSLALVRTLVGVDSGKVPAVEPGFAGRSLEWFKVGRYTIPVDEEATMLIPFRGGQFSFPFVSLADVLADRVKPELLKGKVAIIGTTAPGLKDLRSTPVEAGYAGVEIHANLVSGIVDQKLKGRPPYMIGAEVLLLLVVGVALSLVIPLLPPLWATAAGAAGIGLAFACNLAAWQSADLVLPIANTMLMVAVLYTFNMAYGYFVESRSRRRIAGRFREYVPPEVVAKMELDPNSYDMPRTAELTILFSDVRGFTGISETLKPEELREYINEYLTEMSMIIRSRHRGTLDKYIGDAIMAFWGAPVDDPAHARNGLMAALEMQRACQGLNERFKARGWPALGIGVGVNTGLVRVGDMGSQVRRAYTAMGDAVNVASRLESLTRYYRVDILVGQATRNAVKELAYREVDRIKVKGKDEALTIYEPVGAEGALDKGIQEELKLWNQTLRAYRAQQWDEADVGLINLQRLSSGRGLYARYAERVAALRRAPPAAGWDGVTVFEQK